MTEYLQVTCTFKKRKRLERMQEKVGMQADYNFNFRYDVVHFLLYSAT